MNTFKKIAATVLAAATAATMTVTASAAVKTFATTGDTYGNNTSDNTVYYTELSSIDYFRYSSIESDVMEGNVILSIDFADPNSHKKAIPEGRRSMVSSYMGTLDLKDANDRPLLQGRYPLEVLSTANRGKVSVFVSTNRIFVDAFEITGAKMYPANSWTFGEERVVISYKIADHYVLPTFIAKVGNRNANISKNRLGSMYTTSFGTTREVVTTGELELTIPKENAGTYDVTVNGVKVGTVNIPGGYSNKNISASGITLSYKN